MGTKIMVNPASLKSASQKIDQQATDYETIYKKLFDEVDGMAVAWKGADNMAFVNQIKGFMDDFQSMTTLMRQYSEFLNRSASTYTATQDDIIAKAKQLTN